MSTILIVEDDQALAASVKQLIESWNHAVQHAESAEQAFTMITAFRPDLILTDIGLPGITGLEALAGMAERCDSPIVVMTANADSDKRTDAMLLGAKELIGKPLDPKILEETLRTLLAPPA